jgi:hypothetical protein
MRHNKTNFKALQLVLLLFFCVFFIVACASKPPADVLLMEDKGNGTSTNPTAEQSASSNANDSSQIDNTKLSGTYKWIHKNFESNSPGATAVAIGDVVQIVINSDGSGTFNTSIPCRLSGNELLIDWPLGDKANSIMTGRLNITTVDGKTHLEGSVKTENTDGFYIKETWVMDKQ